MLTHILNLKKHRNILPICNFIPLSVRDYFSAERFRYVDISGTRAVCVSTYLIQWVVWISTLSITRIASVPRDLSLSLFFNLGRKSWDTLTLIPWMKWNSSKCAHIQDRRTPSKKAVNSALDKRNMKGCLRHAWKNNSKELISWEMCVRARGVNYIYKRLTCCRGHRERKQWNKYWAFDR